MTNIAILTDGGSDIESLIPKLNWDDLFVCSLYVNFGNESYPSEELSSNQFFELMSKADKEHFPKTAAPSPGDFLRLFESIKSKGFSHVIFVSVGSKLSTTINSARLAAEDFSGLEIIIVDTNSVSIGQLAMVFEAKRLKDNNVELSKIVQKIELMAESLQIFGSLMTLDNLVKGGRMSPVRYWLGNILKIKPVLTVYNGEVHPLEKARGIDKSRNSAYNHALKQWKSTDEFRYLIAHGNNEALGKQFEKKLLSEYPNAGGQVVELGPSLGTHTGQDSFLITTYS